MTKLASMAAIAATALWSCSSEEPIMSEGNATLYLSASVSSDLKVQSRTSVEDLKEQAIIWISNSEGVVRKFNGISAVPGNGIKLLSDRYIVEAWTGDSVPATKDINKRYFKGREEVTLTKGASAQVTVECKIANSVVEVNYDEAIDDVLSDYTFTVGHSQGEVEFVGRTDERGYFMRNSRDTKLDWTLTGTLNNGEKFERKGVIDDIKPTTLYSFTVKCDPTAEEEIGGAYITIEIDDSAIVSNEDITITAAPVISGINFDINETMRGKAGEFRRQSIWINAQNDLAEIALSSDYFETLFGAGIKDFDLQRITDPELAARIEAAGIKAVTTKDETLGVTNVKITFSESFMNTLIDGNYEIAIDVKDTDNKQSHAVFRINVSDDAVSTAAINDFDVWATRATIAGTINKEGVTAPVLKYREYGSTQWTEAETTVDGKNMTATVNGLKPATRYEYVAACDGFESLNVHEFTTEEARQLPNSGFEDQTTVVENRKDVICFYAEGDQEFWDSGNHGSAKMSKMVTDLDSSIKHSGNTSLHMKSQFVGVGALGKFAAGNIFIGDYLMTDGTDGVLGWGRPWSGRPAKLRGYVKYNPAVVDNVNDGYSGLSKGDLDNAIIFIAMLDNTLLSKKDSEEFPVVVKTKKPKMLFDKNGSNVIAYGELILKQATAGDGMIEFEVPINYNRTDIKPSYIMCTISASIGGDYFSGGNGSELWIDDLELVY